MKTLVILIIALLCIIAITQLENYLGQNVATTKATANRDQVDYYLSDFSLRAIAATGTVSYQVQGSHLAHWQDQKQSLITNPIVTTQDGFKLQTGELTYDQKLGEITTNDKVFITNPAGTMQSTGLNAKLGAGILRLNSDVRATYQTH